MPDDIAKGQRSASDLPPLPNEWKYSTLADLLEPNGLTYGIVQPGSDTPGGVPIVRVKNVRNNQVETSDVLRVSEDIAMKHSRTRLAGGEVLLSLVGSVGEVAIAPPSLAGWNVARAIAVIRAHNNLNTWLRYYFSSELAQNLIGVWQTTTVQATLNLRDVKRMPIAMPPEGTRKAIISLLAALDDKIAVNDRIAATIDELNCILLKYILSRDEVSSVTLADIAVVNQRKVMPVAGGQLRYIDISSVSQGNVEWPPLISWDKAPGRARRGVSPGDTIWSTVRPGRKSFALILDNDPELVVSTGFAVLTPTKVGPAFLYEMAKREEFVQYLESVAEGSAYPAVRAERFEKAIISLPSRPHLERFERIATELRRRAHAAQQESRALAKLKDTLLPKLISGEIQVRDAEKVVEEAT